MSIKSEYVNELLHKTADNLEENAAEEDERARENELMAGDWKRSAEDRRAKARELREVAGERITSS